jgi:urocanate hydratase
LAVDPIHAEAFVLQVERFFACLISATDSRGTIEPSLGGKLLYAGELDAGSRALVVAANIAGAATLTASADAEARKQAMRDGVVDFLVTTLDEALRILKNELRKRETVAVCVSQASETVEREMQGRGVLPDLQRPVEQNALEKDQAILTWRVSSTPSLWLPKIDVIAHDCLQQHLGAPGLDSETWESTHRWLRLSPRYLGRLAQGVRVLCCGEYIAEAFLQKVREAVENGEIGVSVEIKRISPQHTDQIIFASSLS